MMPCVSLKCRSAAGNGRETETPFFVEHRNHVGYPNPIKAVRNHWQSLGRHKILLSEGGACIAEINGVSYWDCSCVVAFSVEQQVNCIFLDVRSTT